MGRGHRLERPGFPRVRTPRGTTYNAYLILDEKVALIDGCEEGFGPEMLARVRGCCRPAPGRLPGHQSRGARSLGGHPRAGGAVEHPSASSAPRRAKETLALYYGAATVEGWDLQIVGTGDELPLGRNTLQFIEAPMLHWPDSMFTYVTEAKTLLPNDAFGQHLATSKRFADEVDINIVMEEASKYYANILMPFGGQIQKMLAKIGEMGLEIEAIAPSHGVIWRRPEDVARIVEAYAGGARSRRRSGWLSSTTPCGTPPRR